MRRFLPEHRHGLTQPELAKIMANADAGMLLKQRLNASWRKAMLLAEVFHAKGFTDSGMQGEH